jgi:hypothetical protein
MDFLPIILFVLAMEGNMTEDGLGAFLQKQFGQENPWDPARDENGLSEDLAYLKDFNFIAISSDGTITLTEEGRNAIKINPIIRYIGDNFWRFRQESKE